MLVRRALLTASFALAIAACGDADELAPKSGEHDASLDATPPTPDAGPAKNDASNGTDAAAPDASQGSDAPAPPDAGSSDASAPEVSSPRDSAIETGEGGGACSTPVGADSMANLRASCTFKTGAKVADTLGITAAQRAALPIKQVVVMMKENRSFDHIFGQLHDSGQPDTAATPTSFSNQDNSGNTVATFHLDTTCINKDPGHQWNEMHVQVNGGAMDGFVKSAASTTNTDGHFAMGTYSAADLPFYYWLANTFSINDRHFAAARTGTFPNRDFLLLGTADGVKCTGCGYPNASTPTIFGALDSAGVTWGVYSDGSLLSGTLNWSLSHKGAHPFRDFKTALAAGTLPEVSFVDGVDNLEDEHPTADVQYGEAWTRDLYETAIASPLWPELAILWTYDEAGGFADHVPPPNNACVARPGVAADAEFFELGARVPMTVISPYARRHYVSHVVQDHTALTRFIETVFDLPALTSRDANSDALLDMFDFGCPPLLHPPAGPAAGTGGCHGMIVLAVDKPNYTSSDGMQIQVTFKGATSPKPNDWIAVYHYGDVPSEANMLPSLLWGYIGGHGMTANGAPTSGTVTLSKSSMNPSVTWPLVPGGYIAYYLPALNSGADGHTPAASVDFNVVP
jgi:phospholipase C